MMQQNLTPEQEAILQRIKLEWIAVEDTIEEQVDGVGAIFTVMSHVLDPMLGEVATRAIISRAVHFARQECAGLGNPLLDEGGLDMSRLRVDACAATPEDAHRLLVVLVDALFAVLGSLLGSTLTPLLVGVESELGARARGDHSGEEGK